MEETLALVEEIAKLPGIHIQGLMTIAPYTTDPEENEREGWFDRDMLPWGANLMSSDFQVKDKNSKDKGKEDRK